MNAVMHPSQAFSPNFPVFPLATDRTMRQELLAMLKTYSFKTGRFILASGKESPWYLDCRITSLMGRGAMLAGHLMYTLLSQHSVDAVGGMVLGAAPLVTAVTVQSAMAGNPLDGFLVRKETKGHGAGNQIEGTLKPWMRVALVEDVVTTGSSTLKAIEIIREAYPAIEIVQVLALVDREQGGREAFEKLAIPFQALYAFEEILN